MNGIKASRTVANRDVARYAFSLLGGTMINLSVRLHNCTYAGICTDTKMLFGVRLYAKIFMPIASVKSIHPLWVCLTPGIAFFNFTVEKVLCDI